MKLYKDYKLEQEARKRASLDEKISEEREVVVIYEANKTAEKMRVAAGLIFLLLLLMVVFLLIAGLAVYFTL